MSKDDVGALKLMMVFTLVIVVVCIVGDVLAKQAFSEKCEVRSEAWTKKTLKQ